MKPVNLLLLDFNSHGNLGNELCSILESSTIPKIQVHQEHLEKISIADRPNVLMNLFNRIKPSVTFLVSQLQPLIPARTLFQSLKTNAVEPPVIVVTEEEEPDEVFETLKLGAVDFITAPLTPINIVPRVRRLLSQDDFSL